MDITKLKIGESAIITNIKCKDTAYSEELNSLGLNEGTKVTFIGKSIFGHLLHFKCNNSTYVIRKADANIIEIGPI